MTAIIKNNFRLQNARDFLDNFSSANSSTTNHYLFIGKPTVWGSGSYSAELSPPTPEDTRYEEQRVWEEMLALKKISETSASLVIPRSDWDATGNTIYATFDDTDSNLYNQPTPARSTAAAALVPPRFAGNFYVITDVYDVFICLNNGNGSPSTVKPVKNGGDPTLIISSADGYRWKYITSIKSEDVTKFVTDSWIPIKTLDADDGTFQWDVQSAAIPGEVLSILINSSGSGYSNTFSGSFVSASFSNSGGVGIATLSGTPSSTTGAYVGADLHITSGPDSGSIYRIDSYNGTTKVVTLTGPWNESGGNIIANNTSQCSILPGLNISSNGTILPKFRPVISGGQFQRVEILNGGQNITNITISVPNTLGGSGASIRAVLSDLNGLGKDSEKDLSASFVMLNSRLEYNEGSGDFPVNNDYRQLGIIRNVRNYNNTLATNTTLIATKTLNLTGVTGTPVVLDEIFQVNSSIRGILLDYISTGSGTGKITFVQNTNTGYGTFSNGAIIQGTESSFSATISSVINEEVKKNAGEILYLENRRAVLRDVDQIEDIKAIIEF